MAVPTSCMWQDFFNPLISNVRIDQMIDELKATQKAEGIDEIYMPGEIEFLHKEENLKRGIKIEADVLQNLQEIKNCFGLTRDPADLIE